MVSEFRTIMTAVAPLMISAGVMIVGNSLLGTMLTIRMDVAGVSIQRIGVVMALFSVGFVIGTLVCDRLVSAVGHIRCFAAFAAIAAASVLVHALHMNDILWMALRVVTGFCIACLLTIIESWLNAKSSNSLRGQILAIYMAVYYFAAGGSQLFLLLFDPSGFELFAIVAIIICLSLVPLTLARVQHPPEIASDRLSLPALIRISPLGVVGCFIAGVVISAFNALAPVYARTIAGSAEGVGATDFIALFMTAAIVGGFLFQFPVGKLSDRFDRRTVILALSIAMTVVTIILGFADQLAVWAILSLVFVFGGLAYTLYPICLTYANDYMEPSQLVPAAAGLLLCYGVGAILGPMLAAAAVGPMGIAGLFFTAALAGAFLVVFTLWRMSRREALALEDQGAYVAVPPTSVATELDPRYEPDDEMQLEFDFSAPEAAHPPSDADVAGDHPEGDRYVAGSAPRLAHGTPPLGAPLSAPLSAPLGTPLGASLGAGMPLATEAV